MIEKIKRALEWNQVAYDAVRKGFRRGMSEKAIHELISAACDGTPFTGDIIGGIRSSLIEGNATDYIPKDGDTLILDLQFSYEGVWCDTTRTFFIGKPSEEQEIIYRMVCGAKEAGENVLKSGIRADEVYQAVKNALMPYEDKFPHHAGHLFGMEKLMQPQFLPDKRDVLAAGDFVTLEPGLYFENNYGIRVEDDYMVTQCGCHRLSHYTLEIADFVL